MQSINSSRNVPRSANRGVLFDFTAALPKYIGRAILPAVAAGLIAAPAAQAALSYSGNLDPANPAAWTDATVAYVGKTADGALVVDGGSTVVSGAGFDLGYNAGVTGKVTVDGAGSRWTTGGATTTQYIGYNGIGTLRITNGGYVDNTAKTTIIGYSRTAISSVIVDGAGSTWANSGGIFIGSPGNARLSISNGGAITASSTSANRSSILTLDIGKGSSITAGTFGCNGTFRLVAGAGAASGTYAPISASTWSLTGTTQALGGIWNAANHTVTVSGAATGAAVSALTADLATTQRFLFTDDSTGKSAGAGFQAATSPTNLTLTASSISGAELASLQSLLGAGQAVLSGWDFNATEGYTAGNPVYLSLFAGSGQNLSNLNIWHYDGSAWSKYDAADLAYDNNFASFTATGLNGYAVSGTAPVPIPAAAWLLGSGLLSLVGIRKKKSA